MKTLAFFLMSLLVLGAYGDDVNLEWMNDGMSAKLGYYRPIRLELSAVKPAHIAKIPDNVPNPLFGTIYLGLKESPIEALILLDEPDNGQARLWIDSNGNGDLTDDPPVKWVERGSKNKNGITSSWFGSAAVSVAYGKKQRLLGINLYRFNKNDPTRPQLKNALFYYPCVGDAVYCFSDPHDAHGYFSSGIINRFYTRPGGSPDNPADQCFNVSADWAPGSSGAAVLDECANIIGHVARIQPLFGKKQGMDSEGHHDDTAPTIMTLHVAVPAKVVLKLIVKMNADAAVTR